VEKPEVVAIRTTTLESSLNPFPYKQENPFRSRTTTIEGNWFEEIITSTLLHRDNGMMMSAIISQKLQQDRIVE
jgi:hypothetical protein